MITIMLSSSNSTITTISTHKEANGGEKAYLG